LFRFLTAGESHGQALTVIIEGLPAGLPISSEDIDKDLIRRQGGYGRGDRMKIERDHAEVLSGVRHGLTIGSPIAMLIRNRDWVNWQSRMSPTPVAEPGEPVTRLRPGHADLPGALKYGFQDVRNVLERASARETAARVAAGAVARQFLDQFGIKVASFTLSIAAIEAQVDEEIDWEKVERSPVRCPDAKAEQLMIEAIDAARAAGDTVGGVFEVRAMGVPIGLGSHVHWDRRLDGLVAQALMSIQAVKAVEIGLGLGVASHRGSAVHDVIQYTTPPRGVGTGAAKESSPWHHLSNRAGGIVGGMSNGEPIVARAAVKPIPTLAKPLPSVDLLTGESVIAHFERSDVCVVPAAGVVGEAMLAIVLADAFLAKFGGDSLGETARSYRAYMDEIRCAREQSSIPASAE